jgi:hypothetical protein
MGMFLSMVGVIGKSGSIEIAESKKITLDI